MVEREVFDAADAKWTVGPMEIDGFLLYGPPIHRWGRLLNWFRRRLGRDEQHVAYGYYWVEPNE